MISLFYRFLTAISEIFGMWVFVFISRMISIGYFFLFPDRRAGSMAFYRALFPDKGRLHALYCTFRQYQRFTYTFLDRFQLVRFKNITHTTEGNEYLQEISEKGTGGILLMSHLGNWEVAAHFLQAQGFPILLFMGRKHKEQLEGMQKDSLMQSGIRIIAVEPDENSPLSLLDSIQHLRSGGVISMTGDRVWSPQQRTVPVQFLGHEIELPEVPYILASLTRAPLYTFFAFRTRRNHYHLTISPPVYLPKASRRERRRVVRQAAQEYADTLTRFARRYPYDWFHFEPFLPKTDLTV